MEEISSLIPGALPQPQTLLSPTNSRTLDERALELRGIIPPEHQDARLADMIGPKPKQFPTVAHTPKLSPLGFYVCGATGVGKSRFSAAFIFEHLDLWTWIDAYYYPPKMRVSIEWVNCPDLYLDITDAYATHRSIKSIIERYRAPRLLVLDDAGAEKVSASTLQSFYWILSKRLENQKQTIVTSNLTLQEWHDRDPRIASRLCALGTYHMKGLDWRTRRPNV